MAITWGPESKPTPATPRKAVSVTGEDLIVWSILFAFGIFFALIVVAGLCAGIWQ